MKLIKGENLTASQLQEVKNAFIYRYTGDHKPPAIILENSKQQYVNDLAWANDHAFYFKKDGHLASKPNYCEPFYMADIK